MKLPELSKHDRTRQLIMVSTLLVLVELKGGLFVDILFWLVFVGFVFTKDGTDD